MKKKPVVLKTKRLIIQTMTDEELKELIAQTEEEELKAAYQEMLDGCVQNPKARLWYTAWNIMLRSDRTAIGSACFKGPAQNHSVEIGYGLDEPYWGNGYATEAAEAMINWAYSNEGVYFVEAETEPENTASKKVLEKLGFLEDGTGEEGPRFVKEAPTATWMTTYMCFGLCIGMCYGTAIDKIGVGMCLGMCIGMSIGLALDNSQKKQREKLRKEREERKNR